MTADEQTKTVEERKKWMRILGFAGAAGDVIIILVFWTMFPELGDLLYFITGLMCASAVYILWLMLVFLPKRLDRKVSEEKMK